MDFDTFDRLVTEFRSHSGNRARLDGAEPMDAWRVTDAEIDRVEDELGVRLPEQYKEFMRRYGGGQFFFVDLVPIVSGDSHTENLLEIEEMEVLRPSRFIGIAPVGTGDYWGFSLTGDQCGDQVGLRAHDTGEVEPAAADFLEFVVQQGLRAGV